MLNTTEDFNTIQPQMMITQAAQAANITVAAAVTQFNRPFRYQIVHVETRLPLFMGTVADPR